MSERTNLTPDQSGPQGDAGAKRLPTFDPDRCKACGICVHFCPRGALETDAEGRPRLRDAEACNACRQCERLCPDFAVELGFGSPTASEGAPAAGRPEVCDSLVACEE